VFRPQRSRFLERGLRLVERSHAQVVHAEITVSARGTHEVAQFEVDRDRIPVPA